MRKYLIPLLAVGALAVPAVAQAGTPPYPTPTPPVVTPTPPAPNPVIANEGDANNFARAYIIRNAANVFRSDIGRPGNRFGDRNRIQVSDVVAACLQHPVAVRRYGCIVRTNLLVTEDSGPYGRSRGGDDDWNDNDWNRRGHHPRPTPVRTRSLGCLAALRIDATDTTRFPSVSVAFTDCVQRPTRAHA